MERDNDVGDKSGNVVCVKLSNDGGVGWDSDVGVE